jgi:hypothetical protein
MRLIEAGILSAKKFTGEMTTNNILAFLIDKHPATKP